MQLTPLIRLALGLSLSGAAIAAEPPAHDGHPDTPAADASIPAPPEHQVVTEHEVRIGDRTIHYKATAGTLLIRDAKNQPTVSFFYVAYTAPGDKRHPRPVTFIYNGGPGSSSMWLQMGSIGPVRIENNGDKPVPPPPYHLVPNQYSLLDKSDLVFIDAPGTGYSQLVGTTKGKDVFGVDEDGAAFAKFINRYVSVNHRWNSPKFLFGESYGTTRSAVLVKDLQEQGMEMNGVVLMSSILDFSVAAPGIDHGYIVNLPTLAAIAWYHHKVPGAPADIKTFLDQVRQFARTDYTLALAQGDALSAEDSHRVAQQLSSYIGLSPRYIEQAHLRIDPSRFRAELLRDQEQTVGRLDGRFSITEYDADSETPSGDAASDAITGAYVAAFNQYADTQLKYSEKRAYLPTNYGVVNLGWNWLRGSHHGWTQATYVAGDLGDAMRRNPQLKVFSANGYYDLATPFYATEFDLGHLGLPPQLRQNISFGFYPSGHMIYLDIPSLKMLKSDLARFYDSATPAPAR
ncbi:S10 family peptidase [Frateuria aurantia]